MARPRKTGLDYFPFDVDFFEDDKITAISVQFGIKGEIAAVKLLCAIYRNGYFIEWKESVCIKLLRELPGISEPLLEQIVRGLVKWGFFDKTLFDTARILTSRGIQRRYFSISRRNRRSGQGGELPYLLTDDGMNETSMEKEDIPKEGVLEFSATETEFSATETELSRAKSTQIKEKKIKENNIKENIIKENEENDSTSILPYSRGGSSIDDDVRQMMGAEIWVEQICMRHRVSRNELPALMDEFAADCRCNGMTGHPDLADAQRHFNNWLRIRRREQHGRDNRQCDAQGALREQTTRIIARMQAEDDEAGE